MYVGNEKCFNVRLKIFSLRIFLEILKVVQFLSCDQHRPCNRLVFFPLEVAAKLSPTYWNNNSSRWPRETSNQEIFLLFKSSNSFTITFLLNSRSCLNKSRSIKFVHISKVTRAVSARIKRSAAKPQIPQRQSVLGRKRCCTNIHMTSECQKLNWHSLNNIFS